MDRPTKTGENFQFKKSFNSIDECLHYGTGQDNDHFHCGFTSIRLLQQIKEVMESELYH